MKIFKEIDNWLHNQGDKELTVLLIALSIMGILVALFAPPEIKLIVATYWIVP